MSEKHSHFSSNVQIPASRYKKNLGITNYINAHYQIRDCLQLNPKKVLIIGVGVGLEKALLKHFGIEVLTVDIDEDLGPDIVGTVLDMKFFEDEEFDVVIAAHILEHLPYEYFDDAIKEISRVSKNALIYLPLACLIPNISVSITPIFDYRFKIVIPFFWKKHTFNGEHYWELGTRGYRVSKVIKDIKKYFINTEGYHSEAWHYSYNIVCRK